VKNSLLERVVVSTIRDHGFGPDGSSRHLSSSRL